MNLPSGAEIELVERLTEPRTGIAEAFVAVNEVRIDGKAYLTSSEHPVQIHPVDRDHMVLVTVTLVAKRVLIGVEVASDGPGAGD